MAERGDTGAISYALAREVDKLERLIAKSWLAIGALVSLAAVVVGFVPEQTARTPSRSAQGSSGGSGASS